MKKKEIVQWDIDEASYIGDGDNGVYYQVGEKTRGKDQGWYVTACWEDNFTFEEFVTDDGPYQTRGAAIQAGKDCAYTWCYDNEVNPDANPLSVYSELMFNIQYQYGLRAFENLLGRPGFAMFMTLEEESLTPELEADLAEKIDYLRDWKPEVSSK